MGLVTSSALLLLLSGQLRCFVAECRKRIQEENILDDRTHLDKGKTVANPQYNRLLDFDSAPTWYVVEKFIVHRYSGESAEVPVGYVVQTKIKFKL